MVSVYPEHQFITSAIFFLLYGIYPLPPISRASVSVLTISCLKCALGTQLRCPSFSVAWSRFNIITIQAFLIPSSSSYVYGEGYRKN